jgi:hypothetical protein
MRRAFVLSCCLSAAFLGGCRALQREGLEREGLERVGLERDGLERASESLEREGLEREGLERASEGLEREGLEREGLDASVRASEGLDAELPGWLSGWLPGWSARRSSSQSTSAEAPGTAAGPPSPGQRGEVALQEKTLAPPRKIPPPWPADEKRSSPGGEPTELKAAVERLKAENGKARAELERLKASAAFALAKAMAKTDGEAKAKVEAEEVPWWEEESHTQMLQIPSTWRDSQDRTGGWPSDKRPEKEVTAIVTHAGKNSQEFIDMAVMLAVSLKRHVPDYPRFAIAVRGMTATNQEILAKAGWSVVLVDDWSELHHREKVPVAQINLPGTTGASPPRSTTPRELGLLAMGPEHGEISALNGSEAVHGDRFFWRWGDAFEKLNMFRLPFGRVLYLDADTYVMDDKLGFLLNSTDVPQGNIGMVHDGCRTRAAQDGEYNSGVMLFNPHRGMFRNLLKVVGGVMSGTLEEKPDQPIINQVFKGRVTALDRKYNCIDLTGRTAAAECAQSCKEVVVTHFTGLPKPATADAKFLDIVRRPYSPILHCFNTNHGSCKAWSGYYCDVLQNKRSLTKRMRHAVEATGGCCHTPPRTTDPPQCRDGCPSQVKVDGVDYLPNYLGVFNKTNLFFRPDSERWAAHLCRTQENRGDRLQPRTHVHVLLEALRELGGRLRLQEHHGLGLLARARVVPLGYQEVEGRADEAVRRHEGVRRPRQPHHGGHGARPAVRVRGVAQVSERQQQGRAVV